MCADKCEHPIVIDEQCVEPALKAVKWLGFHFHPNHSTWTHFAKRLALAQAAFERIKPLSSLGGRLTPYSARRMAKGIIVPTLFYGAEFLEPNITMCNTMETLMNRVRRWITHCFYSTNTIGLSAEACLMPTDLYLEQISDMATIRLSTALPDNNIATALFPPGFRYAIASISLPTGGLPSCRREASNLRPGTPHLLLRSKGCY